MAYEGIEQLDAALCAIDSGLKLLDTMDIMIGRDEELLARFHILAAKGEKVEAQQAAREMLEYALLVYGETDGQIPRLKEWVTRPEESDYWNIWADNVSLLQ